VPSTFITVARNIAQASLAVAVNEREEAFQLLSDRAISGGKETDRQIRAYFERLPRVWRVLEGRQVLRPRREQQSERQQKDQNLPAQSWP